MVLRLLSRSSLALGLIVLMSLGGCALFRSEPRLTARDCMARAMYFESNRSSEEGMIAVGTVVMNRVKSRDFPSSVCAVVGAPRQFASGVLTRPMTESRSRARAYRMADYVLRGARHAQVGSAEFFHTAGLSFPYDNMYYTAIAGGNAFYIKLR